METASIWRVTLGGRPSWQDVTFRVVGSHLCCRHCTPRPPFAPALQDSLLQQPASVIRYSMLPFKAVKAAGCLPVLAFLACCNPLADKPILTTGNVGSSAISGCCIALNGCFVPCTEHTLTCHRNILSAKFAHRRDPLNVRGSPAV